MADEWGASSVQSRGADIWPRPPGPFTEAEWEALPAQGSESWLPSSDVAFTLQNPVLVKAEKEENNITSLCGVFRMTPLVPASHCHPILVQREDGKTSREDKHSGRRSKVSNPPECSSN